MESPGSRRSTLPEPPRPDAGGQRGDNEAKREDARRTNSLHGKWPGAESNCRHADFQSAALPTELPGRTYAGAELSGLRDVVGVPVFAVICPLVCPGLVLEPRRHALGEVGFVDDVVAVEHRPRLPTAERHDLALRHAATADSGGRSTSPQNLAPVPRSFASGSPPPLPASTARRRPRGTRPRRPLAIAHTGGGPLQRKIGRAHV